MSDVNPGLAGGCLRHASPLALAAFRCLPQRARIHGPGGRTQGRGLLARVACQPVTILVVDDDPRMRRLARRMLLEMGFQVVEAEDAAAAVRLLGGDTPIDLLFTDVVMPGDMDGRALGQWARETHPNLGVLLTSGFAQSAAWADPPGREPLPLLAKPYSKNQLQKAMQALLDR